jgi:hypothetical protein
MARPKKTGGKRLTPEFLAQAGKGRPKGVPNKATTAIKDMVIAALDQVGGVEYLVKQANSNPTAFIGLVSKVIPLQLIGDPANPLQHIHQIQLIGVPAVHQ